MNKTLKNKKKVLNLFSYWHLGDSIFIMIYLYHCKEYIMKHNITVNYYIREEHIKQVKEFECCPSVHVKKLVINNKCIIPKIFEKNYSFINDVLLDLNMCKTNLPKDSINVAHGWYMLDRYFLKELTIFKQPKDKYPLNKYLTDFLSNILGKKIGFPKIRKFEYTDKDLLVRFNNFKKEYKDAEVLIINSTPRTLQFDMKKHKKAFDNFIRDLSTMYNVVTTVKVDDLPCTRDANMSIKDIAAISTHMKYIVAINTGPFVGCLNSYAFKSVKKWFIFDANMPFIYDHFYLNLSFEEILEKIKK